MLLIKHFTNGSGKNHQCNAVRLTFCSDLDVNMRDRVGSFPADRRRRASSGSNSLQCLSSRGSRSRAFDERSSSARVGMPCAHSVPDLNHRASDWEESFGDTASDRPPEIHYARRVPCVRPAAFETHVVPVEPISPRYVREERPTTPIPNRVLPIETVRDSRHLVSCSSPPKEVNKRFFVASHSTIFCERGVCFWLTGFVVKITRLVGVVFATAT